MSNKIRTLVTLAIIASGVMDPHDVVRAQAPSMSCSVEGSDQGRSPDAAVIVENLKRVPVIITVRHRGLDIDEPRLVSAETEPATLVLRTRQVIEGVRQTVEHKTMVVGTSGTSTSVDLRILLEVPVDAAERTAAIDHYLIEVEQAERARVSPDIQGLQLLSDSRATAIESLERLYVQNRVGLFVVECEYVSSTSGKWNGRISAPSLYVAIRDVGRFFDRPTFRPK